MTRHVLLAACFLMVAETAPLPAAGREQAGSDALPAGAARIVVYSDPGGKPVRLDGRIVAGSTPAELDVAPGQHTLQVNAEGYQPLDHTLKVAAGQTVELKFILLETPPQPPDPAELRAQAEKLATGGTTLEMEDEAVVRERDSCLECHPRIPRIQAEGVHRGVSCERCHDAPGVHVADGRVIGAMPVISGQGVPVLCLTCHDQDRKGDPGITVRRIDPAAHLREKEVRPRTACDQCHQVHAPMMWVHQARDMVGLPPLVKTVPLLEEGIADKARSRFNSLAQTFLIFPLASGLIGITAFRDDPNYPSQEVFLSGLALVAGSYLAGKMVYHRKLQEVRAINEEREILNRQAKDFGLRLARARAEYDRRLAAWQDASEGRGQVEIIADSAAP